MSFTLRQIRINDTFTFFLTTNVQQIFKFERLQKFLAIGVKKNLIN